jgi:hypothetical protein
MIAGKWLVLGVFGVAGGLALFAFVHHYRASHRAAQFWGRADAQLLVGSAEVWALALGPPDPDEQGSTSPAHSVVSPAASGFAGETPPSGERFAGRPALRAADLSQAPGLIHFRHAFTQDDHFEWAGLRTEAPQDTPWALALRFAGPREAGELVLLLTRDADAVGRWQGDERPIEVLPCPRLSEPLRRYLAAEAPELFADEGG